MKGEITYKGREFTVDLARPMDISIPVRGDRFNVSAWYLPPPRIEPHSEGNFVAKVAEGASINFNDIWFNPHAHGTHTECVGHITKEFRSVNAHLERYFFMAQLVTVAPEKRKGDFIISERLLRYGLPESLPEAVIIRTLPNSRQKSSEQYSHTNPPYLLADAAEFLRKSGVDHLLVDLPSVDRERDSGALEAHRAFWDVHGEIRYHATITELIYVANTIPDGGYLLNLQMAPFENDAAPSRPILYGIHEKTGLA